MKPRNHGLHAAVERIVDLKIQIPAYKQVAEKHRVKPGTVAKLVSALLAERRKSINTQIHVEQNDEKIAP
jgi:hypothetical protein